VPIPPAQRADAEAALAEFCEKHSSDAGADSLRYSYEFETSAALLVQQKPAFLTPGQWNSVPIAKFRYSEARDSWSLCWRDTNRRWQRFSEVKAEKDIRKLLDVVVSDPLGVFWS
jgi:hypothetical protein